MLNRSVHRWISLPVVIFMFFVTVTGIVLSVQEIQGEGGRPEQRSSALRPDDRVLLGAALEAFPAAQAALPELKLQRVELSVTAAGPVAKYFSSNRRAASVEADLVRNVVKVVPPPQPSMHGLFVTLHSGKWFGMAGLVVVLLCGVALAALSVTGLLVYIDMYRRRNDAGKSGLFWS
jgi:uncharacterized iron-regulated membrane protein